MITAQIIDFWKGINFETGKESVKISIRLPGGLLVDVPIPTDYLPKLINAVDTGAADTEEMEEAEEVEPPPLPAGEKEIDPSNELVRWRELPETVLPEQYKLALHDMGLPDEMKVLNVFQIRNTISEEYTQHDWEMLEKKYSVQLQPQEIVQQVEHVPEPVAPPAPKRGMVEWSAGSVMSPAVPSRTVPKDAFGYPIVKRTVTDVDPGEVAAPTDDDGVEDF